MNAKEAASIMAIALAVVMLAGLAIVPALTEQKADAVCKPKKPKHNTDAVAPEPSFTPVKCEPIPDNVKCVKKPKEGPVDTVPEPSLTQVKKTCEPPVIDIKCDGSKNNGDPCKPRKSKDNV